MRNYALASSAIIPMTQGSDGVLGEELVEIKTMSPEKTNEIVHVKRAGGFKWLCVVRISADFKFKAHLVPRGKLAEGTGKIVKYKYESSADASNANSNPWSGRTIQAEVRKFSEPRSPQR